MGKKNIIIINAGIRGPDGPKVIKKRKIAGIRCPDGPEDWEMGGGWVTAGIRGPDGLTGKKKIKAGIRGPDGQIKNNKQNQVSTALMGKIWKSGGKRKLNHTQEKPKIMAKK